MPVSPNQSVSGHSRIKTLTSNGMVAGLDGPVRQYFGLRYGEPALGHRRWRAPQPVAPWLGVFDADRFAEDCPQLPGAALLRGSAQGEDCLRLNIWAPADQGGPALPVMVWIHGGGFVGGSGSDLRCDGAALALRGVVVVTINYRTGVFGFLAHPGLSQESANGVSGNYGLLDQIEALRWVRANIAAFGGSPDRITVFGCSAGSASIALLLLAEQARGLFHQVILHSPGTCRPLGSLQQAESLGMSLGEDLDGLRRLDGGDLLLRARKLNPAMRGLTTPRLLRPIRDGWLIPEDEMPAYAANAFLKVPMLIGTNRDEGTKLTASWTIEGVDQYQALLSQSFGAMASEAARLYPVTQPGQVRARVAELFADTQFNFGADKLGLAMSAHQPTYRYVFQRRCAGLQDGPHHGDEVPYAFGNLSLLPNAAEQFDSADHAVSVRMQAAWVNFAKTGNPNDGSGPEWPVFQQADMAHLVLDDSVSLGLAWRRDQSRFIDKVMTAVIGHTERS